jgi:phosphopantetheine adenylyltransferase
VCSSDLSIIAAICHDLVEDSDVELQTIEDMFGETVAFLVDGVTKISAVAKSGEENNLSVESFQKLIIAAANDPRVLIIKLADRVHNLRTITPLPKSRQQVIAKETLESNVETVCVYPDWNRIDSNSKLIRQELTREFSLETLLCDGICIPGPGAIFRAEIAKKIGGRKLQWKYVGDYDFWLRLSVYGKFQRIPQFLAQWREHPESTSLKMRGKTMALERIGVIEEYLESNSLDRQKSRRARSTAYYQASLLSYFSKEVSGRKYMFVSLFHSRFQSIQFTLPELLFISGLPLTRFLWNFKFLLKIRKYYETNR